jgi:uncharacterized membrane protein (DUF4010 family)
MDIDHLLSRLAVALGIGLLVGLERGWKTRDVKAGRRAAGIRTFALSGLLGGLVAALAQATGNAEGEGLVLGFGFAVFATVFAVFERDADRAAGSYSATTTVAALLTFVLGAYALIGDLRVAAAAAVAATGILAARQDIHAWVERITWPELRSVLVLLAMTFIVLPVLPDANVGPSGGANPREVWLIAIVLAGVSFLGYGAVRLLGAERGVLLAALAGGLVSSTAVTLTNARRAAAGEGAPRLLAAGVSAATAVSFLRVIAIVAVMKPVLLILISPALAVAALVAVLHALASVYWRAASERRDEPPPVEFRNPFSFWPVVGFAVFLGVVIVLGRAVGEAFGAGGVLLGAAGLGLADVDAITISMSRLVPAPLTQLGAAEAILAAVASNMFSKLVIAGSTGRGRFAGEVAAMTVGCWLAALAALWAVLAVAGS